MLGKLIKKIPRPGNILNLKTPAINKELRKLYRALKQRDFRIAKLQELKGKSLTAILNVIHASKTAIKPRIKYSLVRFSRWPVTQLNC